MSQIDQVLKHKMGMHVFQKKFEGTAPQTKIQYALGAINK